ncbi:hypothetical protein NW767_001521 [Fusarium falciforme]|nr:hypothetical protein NW767_001521 [Fusarium falciforme]
MTTQDENAGLKPASATTPDPPVVDVSADVTGLHKRSEDGDDSNLSLSKSKSTVSMGDDAVVELPPTAEPSIEGHGGATEVLPPSKSNSVVDGNDDAIVEPLSTTEPPATKLDGDDDALTTVAAKDDAIVELLLTTEPLATKHDRDDDTRLPNKKSKLLDQQNGGEDCKSPSTTELKPPVVNDFKDFTICNEVDEFDDTDECLSTYTLVMMVGQDSYAAWIGTVNAPRDQAIYPPVPPDMQVVATSDFTLDNETWLKRPLIHAYSKKDPTNWTADVFLGEIKAHQLVEEHPHRNLVEFKGCLEKDGLVVGVLQKRYPTALNFRVEARSQPPYSATAFYDDIEAGLRHLHSLGFAHNDLNPANVMVDAEDRPIVIDLGATRPLGQVLHQGGTPGWCDGFQMTSCVANDEIGLRLMKEYLQEHQKKK